MDALPLSNSSSQLDLLKLLAHDLRWSLLAALAYGDYCVRELADRLGQPQNLISYHLKRLCEKHLVIRRQSSADGRDAYYALNLDQLRILYFAAGETLHPGLGPLTAPAPEFLRQLAAKHVRVLFLCTENRARSQMAEGILRHLSQGTVEAFSAGIKPSEVHPLAIQTLAAMGIDISEQRSKHVDELLDLTFDYVVTVCDSAREVCPSFPGKPKRLHWSIADPAAAPEEEQTQAFELVALELTRRARTLLLLIGQEK